MNASAPRLFLAIAVAGGILVGCGGDDDEETTTTTEALTPQEVIEQATPAVVQLTGTIGDEKVGGSGVLYSTDAGARVLTNQHVVAGLSSISAEVNDQKVSARVVGEAPCQDVAVLELVNPPTDLATMPFGEAASVQSGDEVVALGFPISAQRAGQAAITSSEGDVSNPDVVGNQISPALPQYPALIQHTATINPGSSGGPLFDDSGEVIGINTLSSAGGGVENQFYAIQIDHIRGLLPDLEAGNDQVNLGWNIVPFELLPPEELAQDIVDQFGTSTDLALNVSRDLVGSGVKGLYVLETAPDSPAEKGNIFRGDLITEIDGTNVRSVPQVCRILESKSPGDTIEVGGQFITSGKVGQIGDTFEPQDVKIPEEQLAMTSAEGTTTTGTTTTGTTTTTTAEEGE